MKKTIYIAVLVGLSIGCKQIKQLGNINANIPYSQDVTVPTIAGDSAGYALPGGGVSLPFPSFPVVTNSQQYIATYKTSTDKIISFDLTKMQVQILSPSTQNFDFLDSIQIFISADNEPEVLAAYQYGVAKGQTVLTLNVTPNVNLKNYFIQDTMYFRINTHIDAIPATGTQLNISSTFNLQANLLD